MMSWAAIQVQFSICRVKREAEEVERKKREEAEAAEKVRAEAAKKEKEGAKKALKKERKQLRTLCKDHEFYAKDEEEKLVHMTELEKLCELLQVRLRALVFITHKKGTIPNHRDFIVSNTDPK